MKTTLPIIILLLTTLTIAQDLSQLRVVGKGEYLQRELISKSIRDSNGDVCAAVVISTDMVGLSFQSNNGIVKTNSNPGRHFIFVSPTERVIEVFKSSYEPLKIILNDYGISLKSGQTWQIKITGDKKTSDLIPISIISNVEDASIYIDDNLRGSGRIHQLSKGNHKIQIVKEGYKSASRTIELSENNADFSFTLKEIELIPVQIKSTPSEAQIIIDNADKGKTDKGLFLYADKYELKLTKLGYFDVIKEIVVIENGNNIFRYNLIKNSGELLLTVTPSDAQILINKEDYSEKSIIDLTPGKYKVEISKDGYYSKSETIDIQLGEKVSKNFILKQKVGKLQFSINPLDADVLLKRNGKTLNKWKGIKISKDIPVGSYELECSYTGYNKTTKIITIEDGKTTIEDINLQKVSITQKRPTITSENKIEEGVTAETVIEKYINAIGGRATIEKITDRSIFMKASIQGVEVKIDALNKAPNKYRSTLDMGVMKLVRICDGVKATVITNGQEKLIEGDELIQLKIEATLNIFLDYQSAGVTNKLNGIEEVEGKDAYAITLQLPNEMTSVNYYDKESGLLVKQSKLMETPQGVITQNTFLGNYKEVEGIKYPFKISQSVGPQSIEMEVSSISINSGLSDNLFEIK